MKKKIISCIMAGVLSLGLMACGNGKSVESKKESGEKVELSLWSYYSDGEQKQLEAMIEKFNDSQENIKVSHQYIPFSDLKKQLSVGIAAGNLPDLAIIDNPDHAAYAAMGMFADITDKVNEWGQQEKYFEGPWDSVVYDGKVYGVPFVSNCLALFYNKDMFEQAGVEPPTNWTELEEVSKKLSKDGVYGLGIVANKSEEGVFHFLPWILSTGADILKLDTPEAAKALDYIKNLIDENAMSKEIVNLGPGDLSKYFTSEKLAMMVNGPWMIPGIEEENPNFEWGIVKIPMDNRYASVLGGENLGVIKGGHEDEAWEFIKFMADESNMQEFISKTGYFPPRKDVAEDKFWTEDPLKSVFLEQMEYALPRGPHPKWPEISNAIAVAMHEAITGVKTSEDALKDAQITIDEVLNSN